LIDVIITTSLGKNTLSFRLVYREVCFIGTVVVRRIVANHVIAWIAVAVIVSGRAAELAELFRISVRTRG
jgi:hypothetical protein